MVLDLQKLERLELALVAAESVAEHLRTVAHDRRQAVLGARRTLTLAIERSGLPRALLNLGPRHAVHFVAAFEEDPETFIRRAEAVAKDDPAVERMREFLHAVRATEDAEKRLAEAVLKRNNLAGTVRKLREFARQAHGFGNQVSQLPTMRGAAA